MNNSSTSKLIKQVIPARQTSDGAGVKILRSLGRNEQARVDPFLMLDQFSSDDAKDYIAGFPSHPHRGFQTVTYMLDGHMLHEDHMGNQGHLRSGDVQWMVAGKGIIHSEMPQQEEGSMKGFQLWINLPSDEKMKPASYRDISHSEMPWHSINKQFKIKIIAGSINLEGKQYSGPIQGLSMKPLMLDMIIDAEQDITVPLDPKQNAFIYVYEGEININDNVIPLNTALVLNTNESLKLSSQKGSRLLLLSGTPINETVAQYGPFVMNTMQEVEQALQDYRLGRLTE